MPESCTPSTMCTQIATRLCRECAVLRGPVMASVESIWSAVSGESDLNMLPVVAGNELLIVLCDDQLSIFPDSREFMNQIRQK